MVWHWWISDGERALAEQSKYLCNFFFVSFVLKSISFALRHAILLYTVTLETASPAINHLYAVLSIFFACTVQEA